jgi:Domain of unknown function (DUF4845)
MGKVKGLVGLLLVVGGFYVAWNMIPPYFHNYQLQDDLDDVARRHSYTAASEDDIKRVVIGKAASEDIVLKEDQVTVTRSPQGVGITVKYRVHVDMVLHPMDLDFIANSINKRI